ncbi:MAG: acylphosphatase [Planctomycetota bacterium]
MIRRRVTYTGRVQGVGFRATACDIAAGFDVGGFVRNLADGRVELVAEGDSEEVNAMTKRLAQRMGGFIRDAVTNDEGLARRVRPDFRIER